jgi:pimeloyl-ACP methyl ester carboxylesterase
MKGDRMNDSLTVTLPDGRTVGCADYGPADGYAVLNCHGGPGSRLEPKVGAPGARDVGIRMIGIDRPGYGLSTPVPGRTIADWVPDALAVLDALGVEQCAAMGVSTGASYALALAALAPERVSAVLLMCGITDMRWPEAHTAMSHGVESTHDIWSAPDRAGALAFATDMWGDDGLKQFAQASEMLAAVDDLTSAPLGSGDMALFADAAFLTGMMDMMRDAFARFGAQGYADDRFADGPRFGWSSFDVGAVRCPVTILHGAEDAVVPVALPRHTAELIPHAELRIVDGLGHFSIGGEALPTLRALLAAIPGGPAA